MTRVTVDGEGLSRDLRQVIYDCKTALPPQYNAQNPFRKAYGPGVRGIVADGGTYYIYAERYESDRPAETVVTVQIVTASNWWEAPEGSLWVAGAEEMLRIGGAIIHSSGYPMGGYHYSTEEPAIWGICALWKPNPGYQPLWQRN